MLRCPCWRNSPLHPDNNINDPPRITDKQYETLHNGTLLGRQESYCRRIVEELSDHDNIIYNITMESWFNNKASDGFATQPTAGTKAWIQRVDEWIAEQERGRGRTHLVSVDLSNEGTRIASQELDTYWQHVSVFNFHYDARAQSLQLNFDHVHRAFAFNETGFMAPRSTQYRIQGWKYLFAGGAMYTNLDFTCQVGHEDGSGGTEFTCPWYSGCVNPSIRPQLRALLDFMGSIDLVNMRPDPSVMEINFGDQEVFPLVNTGKQYALYFIGGATPRTVLRVPADLRSLATATLTVTASRARIVGPDYDEDIVLRLERRSEAESGGADR